MREARLLGKIAPPDAKVFPMNKILYPLLALILSAGLQAAPILQAEEAQAQAQALPQPDSSQRSPLDRLRIGVESLMAFMNQEPIPATSAVARYLDQNVAPLFDFDAMARSAGGRIYYTLSPRQRSEMADEMKKLFLTRLTLGLAGYEGQRVRFLRPRFSPRGNEAMISMLILNPGHYPARIDFRLAPQDNDWRIVDLAANGTSAVVYYRQMMAQEMARLSYERRRAYMQAPRW